MKTTLILVALVALAACGNYPAAVAGAGGSGGTGSGGSGGTGAGGDGGTGTGGTGTGGTGGGEACQGLREGGYGSCEMMMGWVFEPSAGACVNVSGCGCPRGESCPELFQDRLACEATCGTPPQGACEDVRNWPFSCAGDSSGAGAPMPDPAAQELWVFTGQTCEPIYVCGCDPANDPCDSVYDSFDACLAGCLDVRPRCDDYASPDGCLSDGACRWLTPGCGEPPVERPGCYPARDCVSDAECGPDLTCQVRWTDPCAFDFCDACGMEVRICAPPRPPGCEGSFLDEAGSCRGADGGMAPVECCAPYDCDVSHGTCRAMQPICPAGTVVTVNSFGCWGPCVPDGFCADTTSEEQLCNETAGWWNMQSCGHAWCGLPNECAALIPGCDCGPGRNFDPRRGCFEDPACSPVDDAALCEQTGGLWDLGSCGHWWCGQAPMCDAIIPGCNCGDGMTFQPGLGCVRDASCVTGTGCDQNRPCPDGQLCVQPDPFFAGECRPLGEVCNSDADCAQGTVCCYPCGIPGCTNSCMPPGPDGTCPMFP